LVQAEIQFSRRVNCAIEILYQIDVCSPLFALIVVGLFALIVVGLILKCRVILGKCR
jgi:hypothetical protein